MAGHSRSVPRALSAERDLEALMQRFYRLSDANQLRAFKAIRQHLGAGSDKHHEPTRSSTGEPKHWGRLVKSGIGSAFRRSERRRGPSSTIKRSGWVWNGARRESSTGGVAGALPVRLCARDELPWQLPSVRCGEPAQVAS